MKTIKNMKTIIILLISLSSSIHAWEISGLGNFQFDAIDKNKTVYVMHGPLGEPNKQNQGFMNNPAFVISKNGIIVIDPGSTHDVGLKVNEEIRKISNKPVIAVFNTHIHGDHWFANHAFKKLYPDAKFYGSEKMIHQANGDKAITWMNSMHRMTEGLSKNTIITPPTLITKHQHHIQIDGQDFIIHLTGVSHTDTDMFIEHKQSSTLFLGDNVFNGRLGQFDESSDIFGNIKALELAKELDMANYIPGHGASGDYASAVQPYLDYLNQLKDVVAKGFEDGLQDFEIKEKSELEFSGFNDWVGFDIVFGKHINKMYLETEDASW